MNLGWAFDEIIKRAEDKFYGNVIITLKDGVPTLLRVEETIKPPIDLIEKT